MIKKGSIDLKVGLYLQTNDCFNDDKFYEAMEIVKQSDIDILVFPEYSYTPFIDEISEYTMFNEEQRTIITDYCYNLSKELKKAIIIGTQDLYGMIYTVYANAQATDEETTIAYYVKHTMTHLSAFEIDPYENVIHDFLEPIIYKDIRIGTTICYDCNHPMFSRIYGLKGVDIIINSSGGNIVYDKWYKYNKVRAIENSCYNIVTMGGEYQGEKTNSYVYGFNPEGGELKPYNLMKCTDKLNEVGTIYVYDLNQDDMKPLIDTSLHQNKTSNKVHHVKIGNTEDFIKKSKLVDENIYKYKLGKENIIFCLVNGEDILKPERVLELLYNEGLKTITNKKYVIINRFENLDKKLYETKISSVLKVRAMENFCAVILESDLINNCYQTGKNRTAQVVLPNENDEYEIDLERTSGPESIWKNKQGMKASYRINAEFLIDVMSNW